MAQRNYIATITTTAMDSQHRRLPDVVVAEFHLCAPDKDTAEEDALHHPAAAGWRTLNVTVRPGRLTTGMETFSRS